MTQKIQAALDAGDMDLAKRLAHTIKGVAGNLGMEPLQEAATHLDLSLKKEDKDGIRKDLPLFDETLREVADALKDFVAARDKEEVDKKNEMKKGNPSVLLEILNRLERHVQKRKPKPCKDVLKEITGVRWSEAFTAEIDELEKQIGKYRFKEAQTVLESLIGKTKT